MPMQSIVDTSNLPLFYNQLAALDSVVHDGFRFEPVRRPADLPRQNVVPLLGEEFAPAGRFYPVVFSSGDRPVPIAVMGLDTGENRFVDAQSGALPRGFYVPAYVRRYPWLLAKRPTDDQLILCFDPSSGVVRAGGRGGYPLFAGDEPSPALSRIIAFCHAFEAAAARTEILIGNLIALDLLKDAALDVRTEALAQSPAYAGFQIVDGARLLDIAPARLRDMAHDGTLQWIHDHLQSLDLMDTLFGKGRGRKPARIARALRSAVRIANVA
jgi:hypothetical protein